MALARNPRLALGQRFRRPGRAFSLPGWLCLDLDRAGDAVLELRQAVTLDPDDVEFRSQLAYGLFRSCQLYPMRPARRCPGRSNSTRRIRRRALHGRAARPSARVHSTKRRYVLCACATKSTPRLVPLTVAVERIALFERRTRTRPAALLTETFRKHLDAGHRDRRGVARPTPILLRDHPSRWTPSYWASFVGAAVAPNGVASSPGGELPPRILAVQTQPRTDRSPTADALKEEIGRTLHHELGHYLGPRRRRTRSAIGLG